MNKNIKANVLSQIGEVFLVFLRLGCTSFGGPVAHIGFFHNEFVIRKKWLSEHTYSDLVALCQVLPGPASSQVGIAIGLSRAGYGGAIAAWLGFTLPSAILLVTLALGLSNFQNTIGSGWLHGLKIAAVAVVAQAVWGMGRKFCPDLPRIILALVAAAVTIFWASAFSQVVVIILSGLVGLLLFHKLEEWPHSPFKIFISRKTGFIFLALFFILLFVLPFLSHLTNLHSIKLFDSFFRAGSLVFGGGHVVLPLLQAEVVPTGWVSNDAFMVGYGAAQAIPGPLFSFSAYLGALSQIAPRGGAGAALCLLATFLPSFLLILGVLPFWEKLRGFRHVRSGMLGVNAAVVGLLLSAFYSPVWTSAVQSPKDFVLALVGFLMLMYLKAPSWVIVILSSIAGGLLLNL